MNFKNSNRKWNCQTEREKFLCDISIKLLEKTENSGIPPSAKELLFLQMAMTECGGMYEWVQVLLKGKHGGIYECKRNGRHQNKLAKFTMDGAWMR